MRSEGRRRVVYAALAATVAVAAPLILSRLAAPALDERWLAAWIVIVGPLVFQLLSLPRPEWSHGLIFSAAVALVMGIWGSVGSPFEYSGIGQAALIGILIFVTAFFAGMVGASVASLIARLFDPHPGHTGDGRLRPWHIGAAIAGVDVLAAAILAGIST
jgi:hypothetical protein